MKFTCTVEINRPIRKVVELFDNIENLKEWQDGFVSYEHLSGNPGKPGAKSKIVYNNRNHVIELTETITVSNLPAEKTALYEHKHMTNTMRNRFTELGDNLTRFDADIEYTKLNGLMPKLMALIMPGVFKKQTQKWFDNSKAFAEKDKGK